MIPPFLFCDFEKRWYPLNGKVQGHKWCLWNNFHRRSTVGSLYTIEELKWDILILQGSGIGNDLK